MGAPTGWAGAAAAASPAELWVWGGSNSFEPTEPPSASRYDPARDLWSALPGVGAPSTRTVARAVWTGSELVVWGGVGTAGHVQTGGRLDPARERWQALPLAGAPSPRGGHTMLWTGSEIIVWGGGAEAGMLASGGRLRLAP